MKSFLTNWKTTASGVAALAGGVAAVAHAATVSPIDANQIQVGIASIVAGMGLLFAKDGNVTGGTKQQ